jgi:deoxyribodipyrimidine photo-lyase
MPQNTSIVWLRDDLRIADNPALRHAIDSGDQLVVVYILDEVSEGIRPHGAASRWWLHHSLASLANDIEKLGGQLVLRRGAARDEITDLVAETDARAVFWNRRYTEARDLDADLKHSLKSDGVDAQSFQANLLFEPWTVQTAEGNPYRVFTPFWRACLDRTPPRQPIDAPTAISSHHVDSDNLDDWQLLPTTPDWAGGLRNAWTPGEASALATLETFVDDRLAAYDRRDEPAAESTSHLSPHLRFGEISPFQVWHRLRERLPSRAAKNSEGFLRQLIWREFNWNILFHSPALATDNFRPEFDVFPWNEPDTLELDAWKRGDTGIPLVDAGMRELWTTGYMHNRVRLVTASFLVKNLLIDWRIGEQWFWDTLVDADEANNPGNWQWVAGSGADAAPYFRVFNPLLQESRFDPNGEYLARWLPEGHDSVHPIVDLAETRRAALDAYEVVKREGVRQ